MKTKLFILIFALIGMSLMSFQNAPPGVDYSVTFGWDDSGCSCTEPITKVVRVVIIEISTGDTIVDTDFYTPHSNPEVHTGNDDIKTDCGDPCYKVDVYVVYLNNSVPCCTGSATLNVTGELLVGTGVVFPSTITMN